LPGLIFTLAGGFALGIAVSYFMTGIEQRVKLTRIQRGMILFTLLFLAARLAMIMTGGK
jgi:hypothetical protein